MKFRKQGKLRVPTTPYDTELVITGIVFKSYDKNAGAIEFHIANQDGTPADLIGSTVRLFMKIFREDEERPFPVFDNEVVVESYVEGIVVYQVPDMLLAYTGLVEANLYIDWAEDDAHTDNIAFTFNIDKSEIDAEIEANGNYYFKDFLQLLDAVKQEATDAVLEMNDTVEETVNEINEKLDSISDAVEAIDFGSVQELNDRLTALEAYVDESNNTHLEWGTVDFSTEELIIPFENVYQSPPSVTISITGSSSASYVYDYIKTGETYTGITLTATGEGTYIQIQVIGRV